MNGEELGEMFSVFVVCQCALPGNKSATAQYSHSLSLWFLYDKIRAGHANQLRGTFPHVSTIIFFFIFTAVHAQASCGNIQVAVSFCLFSILQRRNISDMCSTLQWRHRGPSWGVLSVQYSCTASAPGCILNYISCGVEGRLRQPSCLEMHKRSAPTADCLHGQWPDERPPLPMNH